MVQKLAEQVSARRCAASACTATTAVVEIYSSEETGTWTILMTRPDGMSCLLAAGQRWEQDVHPLDKPGRRRLTPARALAIAVPRG